MDRTWTLLIERTHSPLAGQARMAESFWARAKGLLGRRRLPEGEALVFPHCNAVHTVGMQFPIDLVFVDREWRVVKMQSAVPPGRLMACAGKAWAVVEMAPGAVRKTPLEIGDKLHSFPNACNG